MRFLIVVFTALILFDNPTPTYCAGKEKTEVKKQPLDSELLDITSFAEKSEIILLGRIVNMNPIRIDKNNSYVGLTVLPTKYYKGGNKKEELRVQNLGYNRTVFVNGTREPELEIDKEYVFFLCLDKPMSVSCQSPIYRRVLIMTPTVIPTLQKLSL